MPRFSPLFFLFFTCVAIIESRNTAVLVHWPEIYVTRVIITKQAREVVWNFLRNSSSGERFFNFATPYNADATFYLFCSYKRAKYRSDQNHWLSILWNFFRNFIKIKNQFYKSFIKWRYWLWPEMSIFFIVHTRIFFHA